MDWPELARGQAGVISRAQLGRCGLTEAQVQRLVRERVLMALHPRVYLHCSLAPARDQRLWAAVLWSHGAVSHRSAAPLWGVEVPADPSVHVTVADRRFRGAAAGVQVHRVALLPGEAATVAGLPVTSRRRTVLDLLRTEPHRVAIPLLDRAIQQRWIAPADLSRAIAHQPGRHGNSRLRRLLDATEPGAQAESERLLHRLLRSAAITGWKPQLRVVLPGRVAHLDIGFSAQRVGIEVDGRQYHDESSGRFEDDRIRQNALVMAGWTILRFTWWRLVQDGPAVIAEIRRALA